MNAISFCSIKLVLIILLACPFQKGKKVQKINFRLIKFYILLMMNGTRIKPAKLLADWSCMTTACFCEVTGNSLLTHRSNDNL